MRQPGTEGVFKTNELIFETRYPLTKIEMKRFLRAVYGIDATQVHSLNVMGRRRGEMTTMPRQGKDFKRFYVKLDEIVELPNVPKAIELITKEK